MKHLFSLILFLLCGLCSLSGSAQVADASPDTRPTPPILPCGTAESLRRMLQADPRLANRFKNNEAYLQTLQDAAGNTGARLAEPPTL